MLKKTLIAIFIAIILTYSMAALGKEEEKLKVGDIVPEFSLKDAYDKEYAFKDMLDKEEVKIAILLMGDRKVRKDANEWARGLHEIYGKNSEILMLMLANLNDLPFFATESMIKWGTKREKLPVAILLDWKGKVNKTYKTQKKKTNLFIVSKDRKLLHYQIEKYSEKTVKVVTTKIQEILKEGQHGETTK